MKFLKVSCSRCTQYQECPQKTRMYVNYCGSDHKRLENKVIDATVDCRTRRGLLLAQTFLSVLPAAVEFKPVLTPAAT
jgi:hypothetical protein